MTTPHEGIYSRLSSSGAIFAFVGDRIYPNIATQSAVRPYITYSFTDGERMHHMLASTGLVSAGLEILCHARTVLSAEAIADAVRNRMDGFRGTIGVDFRVSACFLIRQVDDSFSPVTRDDVVDHRVSLEFDIWYREPIPTLV